MSKAGKQRFQFDCLKDDKRCWLEKNDKGDDVRALQNYLASAGYLPREHMPGEYCKWTEEAVRHFQKCYKLPDTGRADEEVLELVSRPRCGNPDVRPDGSDGPAPFVLRGCKYPSLNLTYAFFNTTDDLPTGRANEIVREAFAVWADVTPLSFSEVGPHDSPTFPISWERMDHGDGSAFDEGGTIQGNVLAHAFYPPICGGRWAGALHFDEYELWVDRATPGGIRLLNVAIHEIGHLLGLDHSNVRDAIMFAFYSDGVDRLRPDDIAGIQALYGRPGLDRVQGHLAGPGDSRLQRFVLPPGPVRLELNGSAGTDFDLYVRAASPPSREVFDSRSITAGSYEVIHLVHGGGDLYVMVDSWKGSGDFELQVV